MDKGIDATDVGSSQSSDTTSQSIMEVMHGETRRRKDKARHIREHSDHGSVRSTSSRKKVHPGGIMAVRTLEESLITSGLSGKRNKYKIRRRELKRALNSNTSTNSLDSFSSSLSCSIDSKSNPASVATGSVTSRKVTFHQVIIREYPQIPGVNPSVSRGCPLTIDWDHVDQNAYNIDKYEAVRNRRDSVQMRMPADYRTRLLRNHGHSWKYIQKCTKEANIARRKRQKTYERLDSQVFDEGIETLIRGFKKAFKNKSHRKQLKKQALEKASAFDNDGTPGKYNTKDKVSLKPRQIDDLNTSRSKSASHFDLSLDFEDGDYDLDPDDEDFAEDDDDSVLSDEDEDDVQVPTTVLTDSKTKSVTDRKKTRAVKVSSVHSIQSDRTPTTATIHDIDEFSESIPVSPSRNSSAGNWNIVGHSVPTDNLNKQFLKNAKMNDDEDRVEVKCWGSCRGPAACSFPRKTPFISTNPL